MSYYIYAKFIFIILLVSCSSSHFIRYSTTVCSNNPLLYCMNEIIDFKSIQPSNLDAAVTSILADAEKILTEVITIDHAARTFENTLLKMDDLYNILSKVWNLIDLLSSTHPSEAIRGKADENDLRIQEYMFGLSINEDLYKAILAYSKSKEAQTLTGGRKRFLQSELRDFKRSGLVLNCKKRDKLKAIETRLAELSIAFSNNITSNDDTMIIKEDMIAGLPEDYKIQRLQEDGRYAIDLSYPSFDPFMKYADSDSLRKLLRFKYLNIAAPANLNILDEIIRSCREKAEILNYSSYASYIIEESMAKTPAIVWEFANSLRNNIEKKANMDTEEMLKMKHELSGDNEVVLYDWDKYYYENKLLLNTYSVDSEKVKEYFELNRVIKGLFSITGALFDLRYREVEHPSVWHEDVTMYEVFDGKSSDLIGRFYLDLYPRPHKYHHAAEFTIVSGKIVGDAYQLPVSSLVCNFPKSSENHPSLLTHDDAETFFHEFGHLMHNMLSKTELMSQSGTSVAMDFVEAPSQMLENWVWNKESLSLFARHYKTGEIIPDTLVDRMLVARSLQSGNDLLQQVFYGMLDLTLYDGYDPDGGLSTTDIVTQLQNSITHYPYFEGTHQEASFDHLLDYSASYYGYLWSEVYAHDMFSIFEEGGVLNAGIGNHYRTSVLEKGGSEDPMNLVINFLGRQPNNKAFIASFNIK